MDINKGIAVDQGATQKRAAVKSAMPSSKKIPQRESDVKQISTTDSDGNQLSAGQQAYFADNKSPTVDNDINNRLAVTSDYRQILLVEKYQLYVKRAKENEARRRKSLTRKHQCTTIKM